MKPFYKITAISQRVNGAFIHYSVSLDNGDKTQATRASCICPPEIGDLVRYDGSVWGVDYYEFLRPAMTVADNLNFNRLLAAIPEPGYWHYRVIAALATANNGRIIIRTTHENTVFLELFKAGVIGKLVDSTGSNWAYI